MGEIIGIIAVKGGVGKTSCTANLGAALATEFNKKVLVVDANFSAPNLGLHLGIIEPKYTVHDLISRKLEPGSVIQKYAKTSLDVLPASLLKKKFNKEKFKKLMQKLKHSYDFVLIDSSPNLKDEMLATIEAAEKLLVVTSPDYPTLYTTIVAVNMVEMKKREILGLIINRARNKKFELSVPQIEDATSAKVMGVVPENEKVARSIAELTPVTILYPRTNASIEFKKIAAFLSRTEYNDPRLMYKIKRLFTKSMPHEHVNRILYQYK